MNTFAEIIRCVAIFIFCCLVICILIFAGVAVFGGLTCMLFGLQPERWSPNPTDVSPMTMKEWVALVPLSLPWMASLALVTWAFGKGERS